MAQATLIKPLTANAQLWLCVFVVYVVLGGFCIEVSRQPGSIAVFWFANAAAAGVMLAIPRRAWGTVLAVVGAASFVINLYSNGDSIPIAASFSAGNLIETALMARLGQLWLRVPPSRNNARAVALACLFIVPAIFGGLMGAGLLALNGIGPFSDVWVKWTAGDAIGALTVLPVAMVLGRQFGVMAAPAGPKPQLGALALVACLTALGTLLTLKWAANPIIYLGMMIATAAVMLRLPGAAAATVGVVLTAMLTTAMVSSEIARPLVGTAISHFLVGLALAVLAALLLALHLEQMDEQRLEIEALSNEREARLVAEKSNRAKSEFLATISHEIRTPLNGIVGIVNLLQHDQLSDSQQQEYLRLLEGSTRTLNDLVSDVLDMSKIEAGAVTLRHEALDLRSLLGDLKSTYEPLASAKGLSLLWQPSGNLPHWVLGDATLLRQILNNLLSNAVKFTVHGSIVIRAEWDVDSVDIRVQDSGRGIDPELKPYLFNPFVQGNQRGESRPSGTGLGLAISDRLARLMGGRITLEPESAQGSVFRLRLPMAETTDPSVMTTRVREADSSNQPDWHGRRILLAEDNAVNRMVVTRMLSRLGAEVIEATDGTIAVEKILTTLWPGQEPFDLVLMDIHMPVLDGLQATRRIRADARLQELPIIALTAGVLEQDREVALSAGMNDFLGKPIDLNRLTTVVSRWLRSKDSMAAVMQPIPTATAAD